MRILQVLALRDGGVVSHVITLVAGLAERGYEIDVALPRDAGLAAHLREAGARRTRELDLVPDLTAFRSDAQAVRSLVGLLRGGRHDVLHAHGAKAGAVGRVASRLGGVPSIYTPHSLTYRSESLRGRASGRVRRALPYWVERALGPLTGLMICVCREERDAAVADGIVPKRRIRVVHNGTPPMPNTVPDPALVAFRSNGPLVGFMARLTRQKGPDVLVEALAMLARRGRPVRAAIVGDGDLHDWLVDATAAGPLADSVRLVPFDAPGWQQLAAFDVYVLPSRWEAFPIAILEAMAAGLPVVASRVNGIPEAVEQCVTGLLVEPDNPAALADAVAHLCADPATRTAMGTRGRERHAREFTVEHMLDGVEAAYRDVLRGAPMPSTRARRGLCP